MADDSSFLFLDLEYNPETEQVREYGFILGDERVRARNPAKLELAAEKADAIVGHNALRHDVPILNERFRLDFPKERVLDTLMLSSLLFPREPYHRLRKEYLKSEDEPSNPLRDAELCKELLQGCIAKWETYPWQVRYLLFALLEKEPGFAPFFDLVDLPPRAEIGSKMADCWEWIKSEYSRVLCLRGDTAAEIREHGVEWCFLLTLFFEKGPSDFVPRWVRHQYHRIETLLRRHRLVSCGDPDCPYCTEQLDAAKLLGKWFGFPGFRSFSADEKVPLQRQVVEAAMRGESFLAVFPTGGGKSMTFQLPALVAGELTGALTVVISPIVALMKDQVDVLERRRQIGAAAYYNSMLSPAERNDVLEKVRDGEKSLLYISPESLRSNTIFHLLKGRRIARVVVDEAHCFSGWGHDFRVDYLYLADFLKDLRREQQLESDIPVSCFTATAKKSVVEDICGYFRERLGLELATYISPAKRTNLTYKVVEASENPTERRKQLVNVLRDRPGPKIVYASKVKTTESLAEELRQRGFASACYNGKMDTERKMEAQDRFQKGEIDTMVATTAFGMGVDKDDVGLVAHYEISSTLENYVQEAGRAGRNPELSADCVALYNPKDLDAHFQIMQQSKLSWQEVSAVWGTVQNAARNRERIVMSALEIADQCGWSEKESDSSANATKVRLAVQVLEEQGFLKRDRNITQMYGSSISVESAEQARAALGSDKVDVPGSAEMAAYRIIRHIISKRWTRSPECSLDELIVDLGLTKEEATAGLRLLRSSRLLDEGNDWSAKLQRQGNDTPRSLLRAAFDLQKELLKACEGKGTEEPFVLDMTKINSLMLQSDESAGASTSRRNLFVFRGILRFWAHESIAEIHLVEAGRQVYQIEFLVPPETVKERLEKRWKVFEKVVDALTEMQKEQSAKSGNIVWFSPNRLLTRISGDAAVDSPEMQKEVEDALLFLHLVGSIALERGLVVFYTGLSIAVDPNAKRRFTEGDFGLLAEHYRHKAESIHIVGEYARTMLADARAAQRMLDDYFDMDISDFRLKYTLGDVRTAAVSDELRHKIESVNEEQRKIIRSRRKHILVAAGPGSGKTHLLVHKVASLLWMEEAKPDSVLCLTYTRAACRELRKRVFELAGPLSAKVNVMTFHSLAFSILGTYGNKKALEQADEVIGRAAKLLESGDGVGIGVPSVILVDEFQDLSAGEYRLLRALYDLGEKEPRVIAVGDDDQSIFGFRGSSSEYFRKFADDFPNTEKFHLVSNYRSLSGLVRANDRLLDLMSDREKAGVSSHALKSGTATLEFFHEPDKEKAAFAAAEFVADRLAASPGESCCVLTRDNAEAFLAAAKFEERGIGCKLLKGREKQRCQIENVREMLGFRNLLETDANVGVRPWSVAEFKALGGKYKTRHRGESSFALLDSFVADLVKLAEETDGEITLGDVNQHLSEAGYDEFVSGKPDSVSVGTMHSAKGLEWDNVVLALGSWNYRESDEAKTQENLRLLYVAATRARKSLTVFGDGKSLPTAWLDCFRHCGPAKTTEIPRNLHFETGLSDVDLGHYLKKGNENDVFIERLQKQLDKVPLGQRLSVDWNEKRRRYFVKDSLYWAWFSTELNGRCVKSLSKHGWKPKQATLSQVVRWRSDEGEDTWVPLFQIEFTA